MTQPGKYKDPILDGLLRNVSYTVYDLINVYRKSFVNTSIERSTELITLHCPFAALLPTS